MSALSSKNIKNLLDKRQAVEVNLDQLTLGPAQAYVSFDPDVNRDDAGMVESLKQGPSPPTPILLVASEDSDYRIIWGHRWALAARRVGLTTVRCVILTPDQIDAAYEAGVRRLQEEDLFPLEEGRHYLALMQLHDLSARKLAQQLNESPRMIQRRVVLTDLPSRVQELLEQGRLSMHQAMGCRNRAWGAGVAELAIQYELPREQIDELNEALEHGLDLEAYPESTFIDPDAMRSLFGDTHFGEQTEQPVQLASRNEGAMDYPALVTALDVDLSDEQRDVLTQCAEMDALAGHAVRWAALILGGSQTMTVAAAVAYAQQLDSTPIGQSLLRMIEGLEALERRSQGSPQLTPNTTVAARQVIRDISARLEDVSTALEQAVGLNCAGAISQAREYEETDK